MTDSNEPKRMFQFPLPNYFLRVEPNLQGYVLSIIILQLLRGLLSVMLFVTIINIIATVVAIVFTITVSLTKGIHRVKCLIVPHLMTVTATRTISCQECQERK